jgi:hypothetical protein
VNFILINDFISDFILNYIDLGGGIFISGGSFVFVSIESIIYSNYACNLIYFKMNK